MFSFDVKGEKNLGISYSDSSVLCSLESNELGVMIWCAQYFIKNPTSSTNSSVELFSNAADSVTTGLKSDFVHKNAGNSTFLPVVHSRESAGPSWLFMVGKQLSL